MEKMHLDSVVLRAPADLLVRVVLPNEPREFPRAQERGAEAHERGLPREEAERRQDDMQRYKEALERLYNLGDACGASTHDGRAFAGGQVGLASSGVRRAPRRPYIFGLL